MAIRSATSFGRWPHLVVCLAAAAAVAAGAGRKLPPTVTAASPVRIWPDQIGYRAAARKILIVASDKPLPDIFLLELRDAATGRVVRKLTTRSPELKGFRDGKKDRESGEYVAHLDLSAVRKPGRYYVAIVGAGKTERSYAFAIGPAVHKAAGIATWKALYYQRADTAKPARYAGQWAHELDHHGPHQATKARIYKWAGRPHWEPVGKEVLDETPRDVHGGWWDAGNFDKYMGNTTLCHNDLLLGIQLLGDAATARGSDGMLNIPESGNGRCDLLDEVRWCTEWFLRMADKTGAAFSRVYAKPTCPPEKDTSPVQIVGPCSGATMNRAAVLAYAAAVWKDKRFASLDPAFAQRCLDESLKSWRLLDKRPHPWPADPAKPGKMAYGGWWFTANYERCRALAAACYFRITGEQKYHELAKGILAKWKRLRPGEDGDMMPAIWVYLHTPTADADLKKRLRKMVLDAGDAVAKQTGPRRGYAAGIRGYWWGSNRMVGYCGLQAVAAAELADDAAARGKYLAAAEEFVHYLLGRNPVGLCYVSNLKALGAERSAMVMHHGWVGNENSKAGRKYVGEGPGKIGPFPGMVVGGANGGMKKYIDVLYWRKKHWEFNEPCLTYQSPCAAMMIYVALKLE